MAPIDDSEALASEQRSVHRSKVERVIETYELAGLGEELERRWLSVDRERQSLRKLAEYFNHQILETALKQADEQPIAGEIENHYRLLMSDDVTASERTQAETRLAR